MQLYGCSHAYGSPKIGRTPFGHAIQHFPIRNPFIIYVNLIRSHFIRHSSSPPTAIASRVEILGSSQFSVQIESIYSEMFASFLLAILKLLLIRMGFALNRTIPSIFIQIDAKVLCIWPSKLPINSHWMRSREKKSHFYRRTFQSDRGVSKANRCRPLSGIFPIVFYRLDDARLIERPWNLGTGVFPLPAQQAEGFKWLSVVYVNSMGKIFFNWLFERVDAHPTNAALVVFARSVLFPFGVSGWL